MEKDSPDYLKLTAEDGQRFAASWFKPKGSNTGKCCIVAPALAVSRRFYDDFAHDLAARGYAVLSVDFRGFGTSAAEPLLFDEGFPAFGHEITAAIHYAKRRADEIVYVGHSLGGQTLGWSSANIHVSKAVKVASGTGYYGWSPFPHNIIRLAFWGTFFPAATHMAGYFPGRKLGILGDIPKPIALQWCKMCRTPGYFKPSIDMPPPLYFDQYQAPLLSLSFVDDRIMPKAAVDELARNYRNAQVTRIHASPSDFEVSSIGHLNAFKLGRERIWTYLADWLGSESVAWPAAMRVAIEAS